MSVPAEQGAQPLGEADERAPLLGNQQRSEATEEAADQPWHASTRRLTGLERVMLAALLLLLCLMGAFIGLFAGEKNVAKHRPSSSPIKETSTVTHTQTAGPQPTSAPPKNDEVCLTPACVSAAAALLEGLDESLDPCEDFYGFVNNRWLSSHSIPQDKAVFGTMEAMRVENDRIVERYLTHDPNQLELPEEDHANLLHLQAIYRSCMDDDSLKQAGDGVLVEIVENITRLWKTGKANEQGIFDPAPPIFSPLPQPNKPQPDLSSQLTQVLAFLHSRGVEALFTTFLSPDAKTDPETQLLALQQADLALPDPAYYKDEKLLGKYEGIIKRSLKSLPGKKHFASHAAGIVNLEKQLASVMVPPIDLNDVHKIYNPYTIEELHELTDGILNFRDYFASFSPRPYLPDPVVITGPAFFKHVASVLRKTDQATLEAYFVWRATLSIGPLLSPQETVWQEVHALSALLSGTDPNDHDRQAFCIDQTQKNMGLLAGYFFVRDTFPTSKKIQAQEIIEATIQAFIRRLPAMSWLDDSTRKRALEKAKAIRVKVGFPASPDVLNPVALERYYSIQAPFNSKDFAGNSLRARTAEQRRMWNQIGAPVDHGAWDMIPTETNAYYTPEANEIAMPAGIIGRPLFSEEAPEYLNFGAFGWIAGHELTHAFDKDGRQFDEAGLLFDWWSNETSKAFDERQQCIIDQYSGYTVLDPHGKKLHVNGRFTAGEDVADAGGLTAAFDAWETRFKEDERGDVYNNSPLPGTSYTREQLFFISFAKAWARNVRDAEAVRRVLLDPHSPPHYRVLGTLSNDDNFSKAFQCKKGSRYNPDRDRCKVW